MREKLERLAELMNEIESIGQELGFISATVNCSRWQDNSNGVQFPSDDVPFDKSEAEKEHLFEDCYQYSITVGGVKMFYVEVGELADETV